MPDQSDSLLTKAGARLSVVIVAGGLLAAVYLPWVTFTYAAGSESASGVTGTRGGYLGVLVGLAWVTAALLSQIALPRVASIILAGAGLVFAVVELVRTSTFVGDWNETSDAAQASIGVGIWLMLLSFAAALLVSTGLWVQAREEPPTPVVPSPAA